MTIPASHIVKVSPRVISGGSADLETNGMLLTKSALIPSGIPALEFTLASEVASYFGDEFHWREQSASRRSTFGRRSLC